jgi:hypothetical protein
MKKRVSDTFSVLTAAERTIYEESRKQLCRRIDDKRGWIHTFLYPIVKLYKRIF